MAVVLKRTVDALLTRVYSVQMDEKKWASGLGSSRFCRTMSNVTDKKTACQCGTNASVYVNLRCIIGSYRRFEMLRMWDFCMCVNCEAINGEMAIFNTFYSFICQFNVFDSFLFIAFRVLRARKHGQSYTKFLCNTYEYIRVYFTHFSRQIHVVIINNISIFFHHLTGVIWMGKHNNQYACSCWCVRINNNVYL